ncbi:hypothetical protein [Corynebacterium sp. UBA2622]|uniref:hypothetical protein n=1 Tax=Corynebacterium sp. UBA2622 TaxID=1946393 RepID=UPI0025B8CE7C|nr:hypothetical protein [Corynebacterium sp. UBA2622]
MGLSEGNLGAATRHAQLADASTIAAFVLFAAVAAFYTAGGGSLAEITPPWSPAALCGVVVLAGAATLITVILFGHAGAQLAWADFPRH